MGTMADVASLAGVSISTVSHVLNQTRAVDPETRAKVEHAMIATGYRLNQVARSLATSSTRTIGLAMPMLGQVTYFAEFAHAIETAARRAGYNLIYADTHDDPGTEQLIITQFLSQQVEGMIWASTGSPTVSVDIHLPTVLVDRLRDAQCDQIGPENTESTATLTKHLADHGHRRIALIAGREDFSTTKERVLGYREAVAERGLDRDPDLLVHADSQSEPARLALHQMLGGADPPTALVVANDAMTLGVLRAMRELRLTAPYDLALACFDDFDWADLVTPGLTAMRQQIDRMGTRSVEMLLARIKETDRPYLVESIPPVFRIRETCGCEPSGPPPLDRIPMTMERRTGVGTSSSAHPTGIGAPVSASLNL